MREELAPKARCFVQLKGFSVNGPCPCLVYEYMERGSLQLVLKNEVRIVCFVSKSGILSADC